MQILSEKPKSLTLRSFGQNPSCPIFFLKEFTKYNCLLLILNAFTITISLSRNFKLKIKSNYCNILGSYIFYYNRFVNMIKLSKNLNNNQYYINFYKKNFLILLLSLSQKSKRKFELNKIKVNSCNILNSYFFLRYKRFIHINKLF